MNLTADSGRFLAQLIAFEPETDVRTRSLAMYSAAVALADDDILSRAVTIVKKHSLSAGELYEIVLQSYLFLGFPRMLNAAENLARNYPPSHDGSDLNEISPEESQKWFEDGLKLCRTVYNEKYDRLMNRVAAMAPEIFRWMIIEGYGKVLSRPVVNIVDREISIVAFLMMENREKQLHSHIMGALNVGAKPTVLRKVVNDIGDAAGDGYGSADDILKRTGVE